MWRDVCRIDRPRAPTDNPHIYTYRLCDHTHSDINLPIPVNTLNWPPSHSITYSFKQFYWMLGLCWAWAPSWRGTSPPARAGEHIWMPECTDLHLLSHSDGLCSSWEGGLQGGGSHSKPTCPHLQAVSAGNSEQGLGAPTGGSGPTATHLPPSYSLLAGAPTPWFGLNKPQSHFLLNLEDQLSLFWSLAWHLPHH